MKRKYEVKLLYSNDADTLFNNMMALLKSIIKRYLGT